MVDLDTPLAGVGHNKPPITEVLFDQYSEKLNEAKALLVKVGSAPAKVKSPEDKTAIGAIVVPLRKLARELEAARKIEKEPHLENGRTVDTFFNSRKDPLETAASRLEALSSAYDREVLQREREAQAAAAREAQAEADRQTEIARKAAEAGNLSKSAKHDERADAAAQKAEALTAAAPIKASEVTKVSAGGVTGSARTSWKGEIIDPAKVDLEALRPYLSRDHLQTALNTFVRVGGRQCAGARIFEDVKSSFR
ncbi:MAG: hypothetical protein O9972_09625 [Burkholderiales bacterium]|nr:hypothetical protein [Burkholderiales bacterium]